MTIYSSSVLRTFGGREGGFFGLLIVVVVLVCSLLTLQCFFAFGGGSGHSW